MCEHTMQVCEYCDQEKDEQGNLPKDVQFFEDGRYMRTEWVHISCALESCDWREEVVYETTKKEEA